MTYRPLAISLWWYMYNLRNYFPIFVFVFKLDLPVNNLFEERRKTDAECIFLLFPHKVTWALPYIKLKPETSFVLTNSPIEWLSGTTCLNKMINPTDFPVRRVEQRMSKNFSSRKIFLIVDVKFQVSSFKILLIR